MFITTITIKDKALKFIPYCVTTQSHLFSLSKHRLIYIFLSYRLPDGCILTIHNFLLQLTPERFAIFNISLTFRML